MKIYFLLIFLLFATPILGARILGLVAFAGKSHTHNFGALTTELARRGHDVTVVTPFPIKNPPKNYHQIDVPLTRQAFDKLDQAVLSDLSLIERNKLILPTFGNTCPEILKMPEIEQLKKEKFDLVITSIFFNDCLIPFAYHNKAPLILFSPAGLFSWVGDNIGNPEQTAYVPNLLGPFTPEMSFFERFANTIIFYVSLFIHDWFMLPNMELAAKEFFGQNIPSIKELERNASLVLLCTHVSLNFPRPLNPNIIEVGGMHIEPKSEKLPKDLQDYMDGAKDGVIYFSMGTAVKPEHFPPETIQAFIETFKTLKQKIIWKWNLDELPGGKPSNVKLGKYFPQQAILEHPNLRLFITHGGLLSTQEAAYHGVPLVAIPVFGDQELNVRQAENIGFAVGVKFQNVSKESLTYAIQEVLNKPTYKEKAGVLKRRVRDQLQSPLNRAVYWTEYVLRHDGASHLRTAASHLAWYQLYLVDVMAAILLVLILIGVFIKCLIKLCCGGGSKKQTKQQKLNKKKNK